MGPRGASSDSGQGARAPGTPGTAKRVQPPAAVSRNRDASERDAWVRLLTVPGLGPVAFAALLGRCGSARAAFDLAVGADGARRLLEALAAGGAGSGDEGSGTDVVEGCPKTPRPRCPVGPDLAARIRDHAERSEAILERVRALGLAVVILDDPAYPPRLRHVEMPPPLLFVRGSVATLSAGTAVAVVGTRRPTDAGRRMAAWLGEALARAGAVVVSGLAVGIDGVSHAAVVAEGLATVAVLGGGHAQLYPKAHERLADEIAAIGGAVVAEMPPDTPATRGTFPRRNRLVSGMSDATVVVEAGVRSGALITAGWALEQGRDCFLVPGPIGAPASAGCLSFLRSFPGLARVVCGIPELLEDLGLVAVSGPPMSKRDGPGPMAPAAGRSAALVSLGPVERAVAEIVALRSATADELAARTGLPGEAVLGALTMLVLRGLVFGSFGRYVAAGPLARWEPGLDR
jgi:DNA processing protein